DPSLFTPNKHLRTMYASLSRTSGPFLISSNIKLTSAMPIAHPVIDHIPDSLPMPDWSLLDGRDEAKMSSSEMHETVASLRTSLQHARVQQNARNMLIEGLNAQLIIQDLHLRKMNQALFNKEEGKKKDKRHTLNHLGTAVTSDQFFHALEQYNAQQEAAEAKRSQKTDAKKTRKAQQAALNVQWQTMKQDHRAAVEVWQRECNALAARGVAKKHYPAKPKIGKKPRLPPLAAEEATDEAEDDDDEGEDAEQDDLIIDNEN
ncbi:hypothetical protein FISHEDRAFT_35768, partial [Fistulina hepatica ATCC 64428]